MEIEAVEAHQGKFLQAGDVNHPYLHLPSLGKWKVASGKTLPRTNGSTFRRSYELRAKEISVGSTGSVGRSPK